MPAFINHLPDGVAIVSAFLSGVAALVMFGAMGIGIRNAIKNYVEANRPMAVRNK